MKIAKKFTALLLLLAAAACDESPVSLPEPASVAVAGQAMSLLVGDAAPVSAQVLDQDGRVMQGLAPVYSTDNPSVATVGTDGMVQAVSPGTTTVTATYGAHSAAVAVTVGPDQRGDLQSLDVLADSVVSDRRAGVQVVAFRALNGYGQPVCPELTLRSSDPSLVTARMGGTCRIEIVPVAAGEATITVEAEGRTDSVRVRVTSTGAIAFISARPTSEQLVAGSTVSYTVKVLDQTNRPVAGQRVNFEVGVGSVSATTVVTSADGTATVRWRIPTDLRELGQNSWIHYRMTHQNGLVGSHTENVFINGASLAEFVLYAAEGWRNTGGLRRLGNPATFSASRYADVTLAAGGMDQYGNVRITESTFTLSGNASFDSGCGSRGQRLASGIEFTCIRPNYYGNPGTATVQVRAASGEQKSISVAFH